MKKNYLVIIVSIVVIVFLQTSCSIEKRHYRPGFYVDTKISKKERVNINHKAPIQFADLSESVKIRKEITNANTQTIFHHYAEAKLNQVEKPLLAQNKLSNKSIKQKTNDLKLVFKTEALKAFNKNKNALALYASKKATRAGTKNQLVALLLCWFLGVLGVHSFYLGNTKKGAIQLGLFLVGILTLLFIIGYLFLIAVGIWVFIDFIRIIVGDLGPGW